MFFVFASCHGSGPVVWRVYHSNSDSTYDSVSTICLLCLLLLLLLLYIYVIIYYYHCCYSYCSYCCYCYCYCWFDMVWPPLLLLLLLNYYYYYDHDHHHHHCHDYDCDYFFSYCCCYYCYYYCYYCIVTITIIYAVVIFQEVTLFAGSRRLNSCASRPLRMYWPWPQGSLCEMQRCAYAKDTSCMTWHDSHIYSIHTYMQV